jgi:hypothetical protein
MTDSGSKSVSSSRSSPQPLNCSTSLGLSLVTGQLSLFDQISAFPLPRDVSEVLSAPFPPREAPAFLRGLSFLILNFYFLI